MKKLIAIATCLAMLLSLTAMLSACGGDEPTTAPTTTTPPTTAHSHSYGSEWKSDANNHWNECTCGEKSNSAAHADANVDGKCDVCSANVPVPEHNCSFGTEWKSDETNHWHECECGEKADVAAHADADVNGKCDVCSADVPLPPHEHAYGTEWKSDETNHWHECECGEKADVAAHADADVNGKCDVCSADVPLPEPPAHEHNFGTGWLSDETNHWQACDCGEKKGEAAHADGDKDGKCDTCQYTMEVEPEVPATKPLVIGDNGIGAEDTTLTYTATEAGKLTLTLNGPAWSTPKEVLVVTYSVNGGEAVTVAKNTAIAPASSEIALNAGDVVTVTISSNVTATLVAAWEATPAAPAGNPLVIGDNGIGAEDTTLTYTATEAGKLTLTLNGPAWSTPKEVLVVTYSVNGGEAVTVAKNTAIAPASSEIALNAGDVVTVTISSNVTATLVAAWEATPAAPAGNPLVIGDNGIGAEDTTLTYTATEAGKLTLTLNGPAWSTPKEVLVVTYSVNGGEAVTVAKNTAIAPASSEIALNAGDVVTVTISSNVTATLVAAWEATPAAPAGNPLVIGDNGIGAEDTTLTYTATEAGKLTLTLNGPAWSTPKEVLVVTYSVNGGEAVTVAKNTAIAPASSEIALNAGDVVTVTISSNVTATLVAAWEATPAAPAGNPLVIGDNGIGAEDTTLTYTATEAGKLTLTLNGPAWSTPKEVLVVTYSVNGGEAVTVAKNTAIAPASSEIALNAGDVVTVTISSNVTATLVAAWDANGNDDAETPGNDDAEKPGNDDVEKPNDNER